MLGIDITYLGNGEGDEIETKGIITSKQVSQMATETGNKLIESFLIRLAKSDVETVNVFDTLEVFGNEYCVKQIMADATSAETWLLDCQISRYDEISAAGYRR